MSQWDRVEWGLLSTGTKGKDDFVEEFFPSSPVAGKDSGRVLHVGHLVDHGEGHVLLLHHRAQALTLIILQETTG